MALFGKDTKDTKDTKKKAPAKKAASTKVPAATVSGNVLLRPRITEKAAHLTAGNVYTFDVAPRATKTDVAKAIHAVYRVKPVKVAVVKTAGKKVRLRTRRGFGSRAASKKAYVYLKKGDRIEFAS